MNHARITTDELQTIGLISCSAIILIDQDKIGSLQHIVLPKELDGCVDKQIDNIDFYLSLHFNEFMQIKKINSDFQGKVEVIHYYNSRGRGLYMSKLFENRLQFMSYNKLFGHANITHIDTEGGGKIKLAPDLTTGFERTVIPEEEAESY